MPLDGDGIPKDGGAQGGKRRRLIKILRKTAVSDGDIYVDISLWKPQRPGGTLQRGARGYRHASQEFPDVHLLGGQWHFIWVAKARHNQQRVSGVRGRRALTRRLWISGIRTDNAPAADDAWAGTNIVVDYRSLTGTGGAGINAICGKRVCMKLGKRYRGADLF